MSDTENELASFLAEELFSDKPRSVGEALEAADEAPVEPEIEVEDEPQEPLTPVPEPVDVPAPPVEDEPGLPDDEEVEDQHVVWARKKYGEEVPPKIARAAFEQEQHISRIAREKREAEELAVEWYEYAQQAEKDATTQASAGMPLSAAEEQWVETQALANPLQAARQAAHAGNVNLFNAVLGRVSEEGNPAWAGQIGAQVTLEMQQLAAEQNNGGMQRPQSLQEGLSGSIQRLGIDLQTYGDAMSEKIGELGEYHPYVETILTGEPRERDLALMAVYDLVRTGALSTRKVRQSDHDERIKQESELRRQAAGVVTGGPTQPPKPKEDPFMQKMEDEWRARGQWSDE